MSYCIQYSGPDEKILRKPLPLRLPLLTAFCFFLFLSLVKWLWPEGFSLIRHAISDVCAELERFAVVFREGESAVEAISDFCRSILL